MVLQRVKIYFLKKNTGQFLCKYYFVNPTTSKIWKSLCSEYSWPDFHIYTSAISALVKTPVNMTDDNVQRNKFIMRGFLWVNNWLPGWVLRVNRVVVDWWGNPDFTSKMGPKEAAELFCGKRPEHLGWQL